MIVCHCNVLTSRHVREAVEAASGGDGFSLVTPGAVFRQNHKRPCCGCCMPHIHKVIEEHLNALPQSDSQADAKTIQQATDAQTGTEGNETGENGDLTDPVVWNSSKL